MRAHYMMLAALLLACVSARAPSFASSHVSSGPFDCLGTDTAEACDEYDSCSWCNATSVGTGCYPKQIAKMLPKKYFDCDKFPADSDDSSDDDQPAQATAIEGIQPYQCFSQNATQCYDAKKTCHWCVSDSGMGTCYSKDVAKYIPDCQKADGKGELSLSQPAAEKAAAGVEGIQPYECFSQNATQCKDAKKTCQWCVSDSGMGTCYSKDIAKYIPNCQKAGGKGELSPSQPAAEKAAAAVEGIQPYECFSQNATQCKGAKKTCQWCAADSGMGSCFSKDIAKYIPDCKKKSDEQGEPAQVHPAAEATSSFGSAEEKKKPSGSKCLKLNTSSVCDEEEQCSWCTTKGLGTGCYPKKVADYLPEALFTCDKPSDACVKQKTEETCGDEKGCSWCKTGGIGTGCYPEKVAKKLPEKFFTCDLEDEPKEQPQVEAAQRVSAKPSPLDCVSKDTASACNDLESCSWCETSGLGTGCYPQKVAKILPHKYFECDKPSELTLGDPKCEKKPEDECTAPSCVWCSSAAVGGGCYSPEEAHRLPQAVFSCKTAPSTLAAV